MIVLYARVAPWSMKLQPQLATLVAICRRSSVTKFCELSSNRKFSIGPTCSDVFSVYAQLTDLPNVRVAVVYSG